MSGVTEAPAYTLGRMRNAVHRAKVAIASAERAAAKLPGDRERSTLDDDIREARQAVELLFDTSTYLLRREVGPQR